MRVLENHDSNMILASCEDIISYVFSGQAYRTCPVIKTARKNIL